MALSLSVTMSLTWLMLGLSLMLAAATASKLNVPRVLLPFSEEGVDFVLESDEPGGCFKWRSSRPEAVTITALSPDLNRDCSPRAIVSPAKSGSSFSSASTMSKVQSVVTAEDVTSQGHILRCDVIVDSIRSLQIVTRTHELFLEEAPEEFYVRAYDGQGNEFTTVRKMVFKWSIENVVKRQAGVAASDNIRFISFRDSSYAYDDYLREIESGGGQGEKVLLEGIKTGSSKVSVKPVSALHSRVSPADVNVMVVANLYLVPASAYIMMKATLTYKAEQIKSNAIHPIGLPSLQYYLTVENGELASLTAETATVTGKAFGNTEVTLRDANVAPDDQTVRPPSGDLHVVSPAYITINVNPHKNWNVIVGRSYEIVVNVFDAENNAIFSSDNMVVELKVDSSKFSVRHKTDNGTYHLGTPLKAGMAKVEATLVGVVDEETNRVVQLEQQLHATGELHIYDEIEINPRLSVFPWDPLSNPVYSVRFEIVGSGSELSHQWQSSNHPVATVTQNGVGRTGQGDKAVLGKTTITAAMHRASHNYGSASILMVPVTGLVLLDGVLETEVGTSLPLPVSLLGSSDGKDLKITQCYKLQLDIKLTDGKIYEETGVQMDSEKMSALGDMIPEEACTALDLQAKNPGFTNIEVSYTPSSVAGRERPLVLTDKATIAAYKPLTVAQPFSKKTLLGIDSSIQVVWSGGPLPWVKKPEYHFNKLTVKDPQVAIAGKRVHLGHQSYNSATYAFEVTCMKVGVTEVTLEVGNRVSGTLQRPITASSTVTVECGQPDTLTLLPDGPQPSGTAGSCPLAAKTGRVPALSNEDLPIQVAVYDSKGRKFDNFSADTLMWSLSEPNNLGADKIEARLKLAKGIQYATSKHPTLGYQMTEDGFQTLLVGEPRSTGELDIVATIDGGMLGFGSISGELKLNLVDDASVDQTSISIFNHPENREFVQVRQGSGYFEVDNSNSGVAESAYIPLNSTVSIHPLADGDTTLIIRDLCLPTRRSPSIKVHVSGVRKVELLVSDKVQRGKSITAQVRLIDRHDKQLAPSAHRFLHVQLTAVTSHVKVQQQTQSGGESKTELQFRILGSELGETTLTASVSSKGGSHVSSSQAPVHVFPPMELEPRNITLIVGAKFQVKAIGGPMPDSSIEFHIVNDKVAEADSAGLIEALTLGHSKLMGRAIGVDKVTNKKVVLSEDQVDLYVVKFHGVRINTPVSRLRVGAEMPVTLVGLDSNQNTFSFATALPKIELEWSVTNTDAADLVSVFHRSGVSAGRENEGVMRLLARRPGRVTIKVKAKITSPLPGADQFQFDGDKTFQHQIEIQVFEDLFLRSPAMPTRDVLLMGPESEFQLSTNRDRGGARKVVYTLVSGGSTKGDVVSITNSGLLKSGRSLGRSIIEVETTEDFGVVQRTSLVVEVKPVHYMMINAMETFLPVPETGLNNLPRGLSMSLLISYHDNTGMRFSSVGLGTDYRPSRFDSVVVTESQNNTLNVELTKEEFTVLRSWGGGLEDFVIFRVGSGIAPSSLGPVLVGDYLDLDSLVAGTDVDARGRWSVEPVGVARVDKDTGVATLLRGGPVRFSYFLDAHSDDVSRQRKRTTLDVVAEVPSRLVLEPMQLMTRTAEKQFVQFSTKPLSAVDRSSNFHGITAKQEGEVPVDDTRVVVPTDLFECHASLTSKDKLQDLFLVDAVFNFNLRSYACRFSPPRESLFQTQASLLEGEVELEVAPKYSSKLGNVKADKIKFKFISGFYIPNKEVQLSNAEPSGLLHVHGLSSVLDSIKVSPSREEYLTIGRSYMEDKNVLAIPVHLNSAFWSQRADILGDSGNLHITAFSGLTSQKVLVPVSVHFSPESACAAGGGVAAGELGWTSLLYFLLGHYQAVIILLLSCVACVFITKSLMTKAAKGSVESTSMKPVKTPLLGQPPVAQVTVREVTIRPQG